MECIFCNNKFSESVLPFHLERCDKKKQEKPKLKINPSNTADKIPENKTEIKDGKRR